MYIYMILVGLFILCWKVFGTSIVLYVQLCMYACIYTRYILYVYYIYIVRALHEYEQRTSSCGVYTRVNIPVVYIPEGTSAIRTAGVEVLFASKQVSVFQVGFTNRITDFIWDKVCKWGDIVLHDFWCSRPIFSKKQNAWFFGESWYG